MGIRQYQDTINPPLSAPLSLMAFVPNGTLPFIDLKIKLKISQELQLLSSVTLYYQFWCGGSPLNSFYFAVEDSGFWIY